MRRALALLLSALLAAAPALARGSHGGSYSATSHSSTSSHSSHSTGTRSYSHSSRSSGTRSSRATRPHTGHAKRDPAQRRAFQHGHPCPSTGRSSGACPGYVVDHVVALKRGGADRPGNMQWQTIAAAKAKDRVE